MVQYTYNDLKEVIVLDNMGNKENKFEEQVKELDKWQKNSANLGYYVGSGKVAPSLRIFQKYPLVTLLLGTAVLAITVLSMISSYKSTNGIKELLIPIAYDFIPFVISFILIKIGFSSLLDRKK